MPSRSPRPMQIGWQIFREIGSRPYDTSAGFNISMVRYETHCADCGEHFEGMATRTSWRKREVGRRCIRHRRTGGAVDNLSPPVPLASLPHWARPKTDAKSLKASLGRRQHQCWFLRPKERLRIFEPQDAQRRREAHNAKARVEMIAKPDRLQQQPLRLAYLE